MRDFLERQLRELRSNDSGQDIAEYSVVLGAMILAVFATIHLVGGSAHAIFVEVARLLH